MGHSLGGIVIKQVRYILGRRHIRVIFITFYRPQRDHSWPLPGRAFQDVLFRDPTLRIDHIAGLKRADVGTGNRRAWKQCDDSDI